MWEKVLESVLLKCCLLLFQLSVSAGGPAARGGMEPGGTFLESDGPIRIQIQKATGTVTLNSYSMRSWLWQALGTALGILP